MAKEFTVIGERCKGLTSFDRKWFETTEDAEAHAKTLLRGKIRSGECKHTDTPALLVVQVKRVVGVRQIPIESYSLEEYGLVLT